MDHSPRKAAPLRTLLATLVLTAALCCATASSAWGITVWAVGDGAVEGNDDDRLAAWVATQPIDRLLYLGDVYETGTYDEFQTNYGTSWGRFKSITSPTPGNHEWPNHTTGYDRYWGARAVNASGDHWYSFDADGWHFVSLNTEEDMGPGSRQLRWLRRDLAERPGNCTIAFFHRSRFSAGGHGDAGDVDPVWRALEGHAIVALTGHSHNYQRFHPNRGITQFVVGTGGRRPLDPVDLSDSRLATADWRRFGAMRLRVDGRSLSYAQVARGGRVVDRGSLRCDDTPTGDRPYVSIASPRSGRAYSRRLRTLRGSTAQASTGVHLTLVRRGANGCRVYVGRRRLRRAPCDTRRAVTASAHSRWSHRVRARLPRGRYVLTARVESPAGLRDRDRARFRIR